MPTQTVTLVEKAIDGAYELKSKLPPETLPIRGMSGKKGRHFLNNLAAAFTPYLEVGTYSGSTLISAGYHNTGLILGIDNFSICFNLSEDDKPRERLLANMQTYTDHARVSIMDTDFFSSPVASSVFKCCFYDGGHTKEDHRSAVEHCMSRWAAPGEFVYIVDDWNRDFVREGTLAGISGMKLACVYQCALGADKDDDAEGFWNGMGVFVLTTTPH